MALRARVGDREEARPPGTARRVDLDFFAQPRSEERTTERRIGGRTADTRDLERQAIALVVLDLDGRPDADPPARGCIVLDENGPIQPITDRPDPMLQESLFVPRGVVLEILRQVTEPSG